MGLTASQSVGQTAGAMLLAQHAISALLALGHGDLLDTLQARAMEAASTSLQEADQINFDEAMDQARMVTTAILAGSRIKAALDAKLKS